MGMSGSEIGDEMFDFIVVSKRAKGTCISCGKAFDVTCAIDNDTHSAVRCKNEDCGKWLFDLDRVNDETDINNDESCKLELFEKRIRGKCPECETEFDITFSTGDDWEYQCVCEHFILYADSERIHYRNDIDTGEYKRRRDAALSAKA